MQGSFQLEKKLQDDRMEEVLEGHPGRHLPAAPPHTLHQPFE